MNDIDLTSWLDCAREGEAPAGGGLDPATGLLDGGSFLPELEAAVAAARREERRLTVLLLAPGGLWRGTAGPPSEELLVRFAARLRAAPVFAAARLTGNCFAVLVRGAERGQGEAEESGETERLVRQLTARLDAGSAGPEDERDDRPLAVPLGAAVFPRDGERGLALLESARRGLWLMDRMTRLGALSRSVVPALPPPAALPTVRRAARLALSPV